ncbi:MAG: preprotein translocase subunit SecG [Clostridia bacterium]|nr:preprotein translocase subunit SecG [Clostridia bacterium]
MSVVFNIILILASLALIILVLMQEGNKQGLGAIGGAAETFLGKNKAKSYEGKLLNLTRILAAVFVVLAVLVTWLNARTYTVTYYDENGKEYFPSLASEVDLQNASIQLGLSQGTLTTYEEAYEANVTSAANASTPMTEAEVQDYFRSQTSYAKGAAISSYSTPAKEGYTGKWVVAEKNSDGTLTPTDKELPKEMGRTNYTMMPVYTINSYTLRIVDNGVPAETEAAEEAAEAETAEEPAEGEATEEPAEETAEEPAKEDNVIFEVTLNYGETIDYAGKDVLPEIEEYYIFYSTSATAVADGNIYQTKLPETMPGSNATYYVSYAHGNFVSYFQPQTQYEDVEVEQKDEEGNTVLDEDGNPVMTTERRAVVDENGNTVTEDVEVFPDFLNMVSSSMVSSWQQTYYSDIDYSNADALQSYIAAYAEATGENGIITQAVNNYYTETVASLTESDQLDSIRTFVHFGDKLNLYSVTPKEGYIGVWEPEAPETMGAERIELHAKYYLDVTLTVIDDGVDGEKIPSEEAAPADETDETAEVEAEAAPAEGETEETKTEETEEETAAEPEEKHNVIFTFTGAGRTIDYGTLELPEAPEGYTVKWSEDLPEIMPDEDLTIYAVYEKAEESEEAQAE